MVRLSSTAVGDGVTQRTRQEVSFDSASPTDMSDLQALISEAYDKLDSPWGRYSRTVAGFRLLWEHMERSLPADPLARAASLKIRSTEEWYVLQVVRNAKLVENYLSTRPWEAVSLAVEIGQLSNEYHFKFTHEKNAIAGAKMEEGRARANQQRRGEPAADRIQHARNLQSKGVGVVASLRQAAAHFGIAYATMKKDYYSK